jgi:hypothetical protein
MTWNAFIVWIWLVVECNLAIICISVPVLRVFVKKYKSKRKSGKLENAPPPLVSPTYKPNNGSMSSLAQDTRSVRNHGIEMNGRRGSFASLGLQSPIIGYDRYGQPILREERKEEQIGIAQAV